ncbi:MAG: hypothetical protein ACLFVT_05895 [Syntrophobacteria bacterium]
MDYPEKVLENTEVLTWALANRGCKITEVPHWVIMAFLEDFVHFGCHVSEQLIVALDDTQRAAMEEGDLECRVEKLMTNVLISSLYEDGYLEVPDGWLDELGLFDFHHRIDLHITVLPSEEGTHPWEELDLFEPVFHSLLQ